MNKNILYAIIKEQNPDKITKRVPVQIIADNEMQVLEIAPEGYEQKSGGAPIYLEIYNGKMRLIVWANKNEEDPTHIIDLSGAKMTKKELALEKE